MLGRRQRPSPGEKSPGEKSPGEKSPDEKSPDEKSPDGIPSGLFDAVRSG